jgi:uncharacterized surface protein with fasciclin (FAS1) repeats
MLRRIALSTFALALVLFGAFGLTASQTLAAPPGPSVVDVAIDLNSNGPFAGSFDTLIAALLAADPAVLETLSGNGQFTVFAPTDDAFAALGLNPDNVGEALPQDVLTQILLYHVARGRRNSNAVLGSSRIRTLQRGFLFQDSGILTDALGRQSNLILAAIDIQAANGVIHGIDTVVLPFAP